MNIWPCIHNTLQNRRAQLLLPAVLLLPLFVLVIYLLVETAKVSIAKVRHQFALDNAAYSQMTSVSVFLNAASLLNGPLPYRVLKTYNSELELVNEEKPYRDNSSWTVFDLFFQAGAVPTVAPDYDKKARYNPPPKQDSIDWGVHYAQYEGIDKAKDDAGTPLYDRTNWEKETPEEIKGPLHLMNKEMVEKHYVALKKVGLPAIMAYLNTYMQVGDTFHLQKALYESQIKNAQMFREGYFLNVSNCKQSECARQSAFRLMQYLSIPTKEQSADDIIMYISASDMAGGTGGAISIPLNMTKETGMPLFLFAYVDSTGRRRLKTLKRGVTLKQDFELPYNNFNINLSAKYKPHVRNTVVLECPRINNNCVWPNPLPKYNVVLRP